MAFFDSRCSYSHEIGSEQWRRPTQDFIMGGVEKPQVPRGVGRGEGVYCGKGMHRGLCPSPENFSYFLENTIF